MAEQRTASPVTSFTTYDVTATLTPDFDHPGWFASMVVLVVDLSVDFRGLRAVQAPRRFGMGFVGPEGKARQMYGGPELPGPRAYAFPLSPERVSSRLNLAWLRDLGLVIDAKLGDRLVFQDSTYVIERGDRDDTTRWRRLPPDQRSSLVIDNDAEG